MYLPEELFMEILLRLPVKSLLRLRSVCKLWCALFKNLNFIALHLSFAKNNERLLVQPLPFHIDEESLADLYIHSYVELLGGDVASPPDLQHLPFSSCGYHLEFICHCNGLVFLNDTYDMYLFNPAMRELRLLPPPPYYSSPIGFITMDSLMGFGYDPNTKDYKVIALVALKPRLSLQNHATLFKANVYSLNNDSWTEIDAMFPTLGHIRFSIFFEGRMHWSGFDRTAIKRAVIFSFHMSSEVVQEIQLPDALVVGTLVHFRADVIRESLALISWCDGRVERHIDIWVMKEYGNKKSWTKIYSIGHELGNLKPLIFRSLESLIFWKNQFLLPLDGNSGQQLIWCPLSVFLQRQKFDACDGYDLFWNAVAYKESLISIKRISNDHAAGSSTENSQ